MRRTKYAALAGTLALVGALFAATPASAATSTDTATMSVSVPVSITLAFSDSQADFGSQLAGASYTDLLTLSFDITTNNATGFKVDIINAQYSSPGADGIFAIGQGCDAAWTCTAQNVIGGSGNQALNWRSETTSGTFSYQDDVKVDLTTIAEAGALSTTVDYVATTV